MIEPAAPEPSELEPAEPKTQPWTESLPPQYGYVRVLCPRCGGHARCFRTGDHQAYGVCGGCGWAAVKVIDEPNDDASIANKGGPPPTHPSQ